MATIVITGATDGLGKAVATELSRQPDTTLILHGRRAERLSVVASELAGSIAAVHTVQADLAELAQVHRLADEIRALTDHVSVLVNNAGVGGGEPDSPGRELTVDGNELRFGVNYLAAFALTEDLLGLLDAGAPARIVNVASLGQAPIAFDDLTLARGYSGQRAYGQSKLAMITAGFRLAEKLDPSRVTVNSLHPGTYMPTKMVTEWIGYSVDSLETGVNSTLRLIQDPALAGVSGRFFDRDQEATAHPDAYRQEVRERLWNISEELVARAS
ncbi:MAG: SDR family NAD(P)-dependent oxidoreductase [Solirubrobacterales bacterium]|nr:SDR family NAD(P)-dependent oxidoreductase [Solirubrobacterales bacterium]